MSLTQHPEFNLMECYKPRDWLVNEDAGGIWKVVTAPNNSYLTLNNIDQLDGDNPCVDVEDCGVYEFLYIVSCVSCSNLKDSITVTWDVPCLEPCDVTMSLQGVCSN